MKTYVKKGDPVLVSGSLHLRTYTDKKGVERQAVEVIASDIRFLGTKPEAMAKEEPAVPPEPVDAASGRKEGYKEPLFFARSSI